MTMARRRFLSICAVAAGATLWGLREKPVRWSGVALGADASIEIHGADQRKANLALAAALDTVRRMERLFSLYDPQSALSRLNRDGRVESEPEFKQLFDLAGKAHLLTNGLFEPTVQILFAAKRDGRSPSIDDYAKVGWQNVLVEDDHVRFALPGMAITFNGVAQGFATDRVSEILAAHGFGATLVNLGEYRAGTKAAEVGVAGPDGNIVASVRLDRLAIATSAADGYLFADKSSHILDPHVTSRRDLTWSSASVVHPSAAMADAFSTALILSRDKQLAQKLVDKSAQTGARKIFLHDSNGNLFET